MLVACRLAGLSALGAHYAGVKWRAMRGDAQRSRNKPTRQRRTCGLTNFTPEQAELADLIEDRDGKLAEFSLIPR